MVGPFAYVSDLQYATPAAAFIMALLVFAVDEVRGLGGSVPHTTPG